MGPSSAAGLLALHAVRIRGMADTATVARRSALDPADADELLLDFEAAGWVRRTEFADLRGWGLTEAGRRENERRLAAELEETGARGAVESAHAAFVVLNGRFLEAVTRWQIRPLPGDPMASNDHRDFRWDEQVLATLAGLARRLRPVDQQLSSALPRFGGYADRFAAAHERAAAGRSRWVDDMTVDSCHRVWFELHEDLLATLGLERGAGG